MTKQEAIALFKSPAALAHALGITRQAIYQWPDELPQDQADRVVGAAVRAGKFRVVGEITEPPAPPV